MQEFFASTKDGIPSREKAAVVATDDFADNFGVFGAFGSLGLKIFDFPPKDLVSVVETVGINALSSEEGKTFELIKMS